MKRKQGFTLAEVLITLTIIGVISALTLPNIQTNLSANRNRATLKNTMAILSQAAQNNMANEGWNFSQITDACGETAVGRTHNARENYSMCGLLNSNLTGETLLGVALETGTPEGGLYKPQASLPCSFGNTVTYHLTNGAIVGLATNTNGLNCQENDSGNCFGYIDVNGFAGPHREITCSDGTKHYYMNDNGTPDRTRFCAVERTVNADIYPIVFHGNTVELSSDAARSFLNGR